MENNAGAIKETDFLFDNNSRRGEIIRSPEQSGKFAPATPPILFRKCSICKKTKSIKNFPKAKRYKWNTRSFCKNCKNILQASYLAKFPWYKTSRAIRVRCSRGGAYYKRGIKNFLTPTNLKYLWLRDKAYLMERPSIDRINSKQHYAITNCRYVELKINLKRTLAQKAKEGL